MVFRDEPWPTGTPCWVDMMSGQAEQSRAFYGQVFGWDWRVGPPESGPYSTALAGERPVCGLGVQMGDAAQRPFWMTYLSHSDAAAAQEVITAGGGTIIAPASDVMGLGHMLVAQDPTGAVFAVWQAAQHNGFGVANEPGAVVWNELLTPDYDAAQRFYTDVFGVGFSEIGDDSFPYSTMEVDGNVVGGVGVADQPAYWRTYVSVADVDACLGTAEGLGASVTTAAHDSPYGRWATLTDPEGVAFSVIQPPSA